MLVGNKIGLASVLLSCRRVEIGRRRETAAAEPQPGAERGDRLTSTETLIRFERAVLPHLHAAYNLARWLTRNDQDAEDVVQESYVRALTFFSGFRGEDGRAWLLSVVRNTCYTWMQKHRAHEPTVSLDERVHGSSRALNPEEMVLRQASSEELRLAIEELPVEFREVIVLRELEGLSYKEIAAALAIPLGTVMSRLTRARSRLQQSLSVQEEL
jgi:RNA polymerase sigma-70 factor (ECF subfamily)